MKNEARYEALKKAIATYKELCIKEAEWKTQQGYDTTFERGELCAYKILENEIEMIEKENA